MTKKNRKKGDRTARALRMAEMIIEVRAGKITAREAARKLGVSAKTYYKWEKRGLGGLVTALEEKEGGRPPPRKDPEKETLIGERDRYREEALIWRQRCRIRELLAERESVKKKGGGRGGSGKKAAKSARRDGPAVSAALPADRGRLLVADAVAGTPETGGRSRRDPGAEEAGRAPVGNAPAGDRGTPSREETDGGDRGPILKVPSSDLAKKASGGGEYLPPGPSPASETGDGKDPLAGAGGGMGDG